MDKLLLPLNDVNPELQGKIAKAVDHDLTNFIKTRQRDFTRTGEAFDLVNDLGVKHFKRYLMSELAVAEPEAVDHTQWERGFLGFLR